VLDDIGRSLQTSPGQVGIAVAAYGVALAVAAPMFAFFGGRVDRLKLMLSGLALFMLSTVACSMAWKGGLLVAARTACGISAGAFLPACLAWEDPEDPGLETPRGSIAS
jgi:predicted MFS family arabinose efflux permease